MTNIKKLLGPRRTHWTGREAGQILLANFAESCSKGQALLSKVKLDYIINSLDSEEYEEYKNYNDIYHWLRESVIVNAAYEDQISTLSLVCNQLSLLTGLITRCLAQKVIPEEVLKLMDKKTLDGITFTSNNPMKEWVHCIELDYNYLIGFDKQIELTIERTGVKELEVFKPDFEAIEKTLENLSRQRGLFLTMAEIEAIKNEDIAKENLEEIFPPIEEYPIEPYDLQRAKALVRSFAAYGDHRTLFNNLLCYRDKPQGGDGTE